MNWLHEILRDKECAGNIQCFILAFVVTIGGLCVVVYGIAWLSTTEKISAEVCGAKSLEKRIQKLENHTHHFFNKKVKLNESK